MAKRLVKNGHSVTFVTSSAYLSKNYTLSKGWNYLEIDGIELYILHQDYSNKVSFLKRIMKFINFSLKSTIKALSIKADVVFATSTPLTIAIPGLVYSKYKKKPLVFEVRDLWPELPVATGVIKNKLVIKIATWLEKYTYKNSKRLVGLSPGMCEGITKHGIPKKDVILATNSCDTELFDVDKSIGENYIKDSLTFVKDRKIIVYTGTFGLINKVDYIVKLASAAKEKHPNLCFIAIGDGMEKDAVIAEAKRVGVLNINLFILPPVPKTEVVKLLSAADLSLSLFGPIREMWHNSANKLFDALASKTPIAINYGGWQKEFIEEHECGLVLDVNDHEASVGEIAIFLSDIERYNSATSNCKKLAYEYFSRDIMAARIENTLLEAVHD